MAAIVPVKLEVPPEFKRLTALQSGVILRLEEQIASLKRGILYLSLGLILTGLVFLVQFYWNHQLFHQLNLQGKVLKELERRADVALDNHDWVLNYLEKEKALHK